jgi:hypothetical protein
MGDFWILREGEDITGDLSEGIPHWEGMWLRPQTKDTTQQHSSIQMALLLTGMKQIWYEDGTEVNTLVIGMVFQSFESNKYNRLKFCKIVVRNKNSSMPARHKFVVLKTKCKQSVVNPSM